jgi:hypothetical protein
MAINSGWSSLMSVEVDGSVNSLDGVERSLKDGLSMSNRGKGRIKKNKKR